MNSQCHPIPLYPHPLLSLNLCQTQVEPASDELSDFPPIWEHKSTPSPVPNHSRPQHSPVLQKQSEQCSSPSKEQGLPLSQLRRHPPNSGLGSWNQLTTIKASIPAYKGEMVNTGLQAAVLIEWNYTRNFTNPHWSLSEVQKLLRLKMSTHSKRGTSCLPMKMMSIGWSVRSAISRSLWRRLQNIWEEQGEIASYGYPRFVLSHCSLYIPSTYWLHKYIMKNIFAHPYSLPNATIKLLFLSNV